MYGLEMAVLTKRQQAELGVTDINSIHLILDSVLDLTGSQ